jgi:glycosyltransferase involved in cell wall biosynthesis
MKNSNLPLVSVVTPAYNGEKYLAECIESVINQTYGNWEYIILNNKSTDGTLEVAEKYAREDDRITVYNNKDFLKQIPNWNEALRKISPTSQYCKVVHADDWLLPECLEKMVEKAEENSSAALISAYRFMGPHVRSLRGKGLRYSTTFLPGKEAGRRVMQTAVFLFGSPSSVMYRSDLVRDNEPFYDPSVVHADTDACFKILQKWDFCFVHQILSFTRLHDESTTIFCDYYHTYSLFDLYVIKNYGEYYLSSQEYDELLSERISDHHRKLVDLMFNGRGKEVWHYHKNELNKMNLAFNHSEIFKAFFLEFIKLKPVAKWIFSKFKSSFSTKNKQSTVKDKKESTVLASAE